MVSHSVKIKPIFASTPLYTYNLKQIFFSCCIFLNSYFGDGLVYKYFYMTKIIFLLLLTLAYLSEYRILSSRRFFLKTGRHQTNVFYHPCCRREISYVSGTNQFVFLLEVFNVLSFFLELKILCRTVGSLSFILIGTC